jgi:uncharacterized protein (TIGR02145 family)
LCPVSGTSPGTFAKAVISGAAATAGSITTVAGNTRGFYVTTNPSTVTATLSNATGQFNWCAYGSDYPPNVLANTNGSYTLAGTPPFTLIASNGTTVQTVNGTTIATAAVTMTPTTITDATGYPGLWCPYTGSDLYMDDTHRCRERQSGAYNWEAWIKDTRDAELYRIVHMPDNNWWLAQNVKLASYNGSTVGYAISGCTKEECGRYYTWAQVYNSYADGTSGSSGNVQGICPSSWLLPVRATCSTLATAIGSSPGAALRAYNARCTPITDPYGFASIYGIVNGVKNDYGHWYTNDSSREDGFGIDITTSSASVYRNCGYIGLTNTGDNQAAVVRCYRQL